MLPCINICVIICQDLKFGDSGKYPAKRASILMFRFGSNIVPTKKMTFRIMIFLVTGVNCGNIV